MNDRLNDSPIVSKKLCTIKLIYACILPIAFYTALSLLSESFVVLFVLISCLLFLLPFYVNGYYIQENPTIKLLPIIFYDFICMTLPSIVVSIICDIIVFSGKENRDFLGITCLILCIAFIILTLVQWISYPIQKKIGARRKMQ